MPAYIKYFVTGAFKFPFWECHSYNTTVAFLAAEGKLLLFLNNVFWSEDCKGFVDGLLRLLYLEEDSSRNFSNEAHTKLANPTALFHSSPNFQVSSPFNKGMWWNNLSRPEVFDLCGITDPSMRTKIIEIEDTGTNHELLSMPLYQSVMVMPCPTNTGKKVKTAEM